MVQWSPPTFNMPLDRKSMLWRQYGKPIPTPYVVMIIGGVVTPYPGLVNVSTRTKFGNAEVPNAVASYTGADSGSGEGGRAVWYGGRVYTITDAEKALLAAAGYSMDLELYSDGFFDIYGSYPYLPTGPEYDDDYGDVYG